MEISINKRGQITIFIILALIIVILILIIFISIKQPKVEPYDEKFPQVFIESCVKDYLEKTLLSISKHGGDVNTKNSVMYNNTNLSYLCYTKDYYKSCINQKPKFIEYIEKEITDDIKPNVFKCFDSLKLILEKRYDIEMGEMQILTKLKPREVNLEINRKFKMRRDKEYREFNNFKIIQQYPMYEFSEISMEIANQESKYCNFDTLGFMIIYPEFDISKIKTGDSDTIYKIIDRKTNRDFNFAIKSCVLPAGI
ncbi:MAG: hypothetical protein QXW97_03765 [Candidatus Pacearchaeota archaeon]